MLKLEVKCPYCGKSLMNEAVEIQNEPSVALRAKHGDKTSDIYLCCIYGQSDIIDHSEASDGDIVEFYCPHCGEELKSSSKCPKCGAPTVNFELLRVPGMGEICSRKGCTSHCIKFKEVENAIKEFYDAYDLGRIK